MTLVTHMQQSLHASIIIINQADKYITMNKVHVLFVPRNTYFASYKDVNTLNSTYFFLSATINSYAA